MSLKQNNQSAEIQTALEKIAGDSSNNPGLQADAQAFQARYFEALLGAQLIQIAFIGVKLGWYTALAKAGEKGLYPSELAHQTACASSRYAREWLEQQAMAGWIKVCESITNDDHTVVDGGKGNDEKKDETTLTTDPNDQHRFFLPASHMPVLADPDSSLYMAPMALFHGATGKALDLLVDAYRNNTGVNWNDLGPDAHHGQASQNRPFFRNEFPGILENIVDDRLLAQLKHGKACVADIGAGHGHSSIAVAEHFPGAVVDIFDLDEASIAVAKNNIAAAGLEDRVSAHCADASTALEKDGVKKHYDLVLALECVHDMSDPISVLRTMRLMVSATGQNGTVIIMEEAVADEFSVSNVNNPVETFLYGASCLCCLPDGKASSSSSSSSAETGTLMRPSLLRMYAQQAGFRDIEKLNAKTDLFFFYKLILPSQDT